MVHDDTARGASENTATDAATDADEWFRWFRRWMRGHLTRAAAHFGLTVTGEPVFGWQLRSINAPAQGRDGFYWLRVLSEQSRHIAQEDVADFWTGNVDANAITGVPKPSVLDLLEWDEPAHQRRVRAEVMTWLPGHPCSPTPLLRVPLHLPDRWWAALRRSVDTIRATSTTRFASTARLANHQVGGRVRQVFGIDVPVREWETVHGDLHWNNLLRDPFAVIDWEMWGCGPAGTDAASLYCHSLLIPATARKVREVFADVLDTPTGRVAQVRVAAGLLHREQDHPDLAVPLRQHIQPLIGGPTRA